MKLLKRNHHPYTVIIMKIVLQSHIAYLLHGFVWCRDQDNTHTININVKYYVKISGNYVRHVCFKYPVYKSYLLTIKVCDVENTYMLD